MHVMVVWGKLRLGAWEQYENFYNERVKATTSNVKGLRERQLLRSTEDPDEGMSISMWDSHEDLLNYERSEVRQTLAKEAEHLYRGDFWVKHFEVRDTGR
jgi:heme-degrading monooxygenase HmoA